MPNNLQGGIVHDEKKRHIRVSQKNWKFLKQIALDNELTIDEALSFLIKIMEKYYEKNT